LVSYVHYTHHVLTWHLMFERVLDSDETDSGAKRACISVPNTMEFFTKS